MRILHVITGLEIGGAEGMLTALATARPDHGVRHRVVSLKGGGHYAKRLREHDVMLDELGLDPRRPTPFALWRLARLIRRYRPDLVQGWLYHGDLAALLALVLSGRRRSTKLAWGLRCSALEKSNYALGLRAAIAACTTLSGLPDIIIANSASGLAEHEARGYRPRRGLVIRNGIDLARFTLDPSRRPAVRAALGIPLDQQLLIHVARRDPMKDHATLLEAMRELPEVSCLVVGTGTEALPEQPNVYRLGIRTDIPDLLSAADVVVSSSAYGEGFCNALAEGMASGLAPIATDVGDAKELIGDVGIIVPPCQPRALAAGIRLLFGEGRESLARRGAAGRARIVERFSLDRAVAEFANCYRQLCGEPPRS